MSEQVKQIFVCYSRENLAWVDEIISWCNGLEVEWLQDRKIIETGDNFREKLDAAMKNAWAAICLISPDFFESDYVSNVEIPKLLEKRKLEAGFSIIPIIVARYDGFHSCILRDLQTLNPPEQHLEKRGVDLNHYKSELRKLIEAIKLPPPSPIPANGDTPIPIVSNLPAKPKWFVGYEAEKEKLKQHILNEQGLIVITGTPRTGRHTLAKQVANELFNNGDLPGGAIWIDCQNISDERALIASVSDVYLKSRAPDDPSHCQQILENEFSKKRCLIVLKNTENSRAGFFEHWAIKIPSPSVVVYVTALIACPKDVQPIELRGLDDKDAVILFVKVASEALRIENPFSKHAEFARITEICNKTNYNPLLIELYANKCGQGFFLDDILRQASEDHDKDVITIWKSELEPLFNSLEEEHRAAFLKLSRLPDGVSRELVMEITGIEPSVLGPAIKKQFLWDLGHERFLIDPSVQTFAETKIARPIEVDGEVAKAFARVTMAQAAHIEESLKNDRLALEETVDWFGVEWKNLKFCVGVAERIGDKETICRLTDSVLQFMIRRGKYDDCLKLYEKTLSLRDKDDPNRARTLNDMAVCLQFKGEYANALRRIQESIKLRQGLLDKIDSPDGRCEQMFRLAQSWNTCGAINLLGKELGDARLDNAANAFETAELVCKQALDIATNDSMRTEIEIEHSQTLSNLGYCLTERGSQAIEAEEKKVNFGKATKAFSDSIAIKRSGDEREGQTYSRRGQLRLKQSIWPLAEQDFNKAIGIFECASNNFELGLAYFGRSRVLANKPTPNHDGAIADLKLAEKLFDELCDLKNQFWVLMELAKIENVRGNSGVDNATKAFEVAEKGNLEEEQIVAARFLENPKS